jgi:transketolase
MKRWGNWRFLWLTSRISDSLRVGVLGLSNLCWIYDNNYITIEGHTSLAFTEDVAGRFLAYGWNVERVFPGADIE